MLSAALYGDLLMVVVCVGCMVVLKEVGKGGEVAALWTSIVPVWFDTPGFLSWHVLR